MKKHWLWSSKVGNSAQKQGEEHPDTLVSMQNLAGTYLLDGQMQKAIEILEKTIELRQKILGGKHPNTLRSKMNLVAAYVENDQFDMAFRLAATTMGNMQRTLGDRHADFLKSIRLLKQLVRKLNRRLRTEEAKRRQTSSARSKIGLTNPPNLQ